MIDSNPVKNYWAGDSFGELALSDAATDCGRNRTGGIGCHAAQVLESAPVLGYEPHRVRARVQRPPHTARA